MLNVECANSYDGLRISREMFTGYLKKDEDYYCKLCKPLQTAAGSAKNPSTVDIHNRCPPVVHRVATKIKSASTDAKKKLHILSTSYKFIKSLQNFHENQRSTKTSTTASKCPHFGWQPWLCVSSVRLSIFLQGFEHFSKGLL